MLDLSAAKSALVDIRGIKAVARRLPVNNIYRQFLEREPDVVQSSRLADYLRIAQMAVPRYPGQAR
jgi:hypothetical protein